MDLIQTLNCTQSVFWGIIIIDTLHRELIYPEVNMEDTLTEMFSLFFFFFLLSPNTTTSGHKAAVPLKIMK